MEFYNAKVVRMGNIVEIFEYSRHIAKSFERSATEKIDQLCKIKSKFENNTVKINDIVDLNNNVRRLDSFKRSIKRSKRKIFEIANTNYDKNTSFLTLTFKDNVQDYNYSFKCFDLFKKQLEYKLQIKLKYCGVVEFQERGAIHFHILLFDFPYVEQELLYNIWNKVTIGSVNIQKVSNVDNIGAYLTSYMGKNFEQDLFFTTFKGKKRYFSSRNLRKPIITEFDTNNFKDFCNLEDLKEYYSDKKTNIFTSNFEKKIKVDVTVFDRFNNIYKNKIDDIIIFNQNVIRTTYTLIQNKDLSRSRKKQIREFYKKYM
ncbi:MAG: hypothetical protein R3Y64_09385 [Peptostreptococcaceae bacterium]